MSRFGTFVVLVSLSLVACPALAEEPPGGQPGSRDQYYEHFYSELIAEGALSAQAVEVGDLPWSEVDTFEDLERARIAAKL